MSKSFDDLLGTLKFLLEEGAVIIREQADEIERLRKTLNEWQWVADDLYKYADHRKDCADDVCTCGYEDVMREYELLDKLSGRVETV